MRFLIPETTFDFTLDGEMDKVVSSIKEKLIGEKRFRIETFFGHKDVIYYGNFGDNQIDLTRKIDSINKIPIYPTAKIKFFSNESTTSVNVRVSLNTAWTIFIYCIYIIAIIVLAFGWMNTASTYSKIILLCKALGTIGILNLLILGYHFSEVKNLKLIIKKS